MDADKTKVPFMAAMNGALDNHIKSKVTAFNYLALQIAPAGTASTSNDAPGSHSGAEGEAGEGPGSPGSTEGRSRAGRHVVQLPVKAVNRSSLLTYDTSGRLFPSLNGAAGSDSKAGQLSLDVAGQQLAGGTVAEAGMQQPQSGLDGQMASPPHAALATSPKPGPTPLMRSSTTSAHRVLKSTPTWREPPPSASQVLARIGARQAMSSSGAPPPDGDKPNRPTLAALPLIAAPGRESPSVSENGAGPLAAFSARANRPARASCMGSLDVQLSPNSPSGRRTLLGVPGSPHDGMQQGEGFASADRGPAARALLHQASALLSSNNTMQLASTLGASPPDSRRGAASAAAGASGAFSGLKPTSRASSGSGGGPDNNSMEDLLAAGSRALLASYKAKGEGSVEAEARRAAGMGPKMGFSNMGGVSDTGTYMYVKRN